MSNFTKQYTIVENLTLMDDSLTPYAVLLYLTLKSFYHRESGVCNPSYKQLMKRSKIANRNVITKHLKILREAGYISWKTGPQGANEYTLLYTYGTPSHSEKANQLDERSDQALGVEVPFLSDDPSIEFGTTPVSNPILPQYRIQYSPSIESDTLFNTNNTNNTTPSDSNNLVTENAVNPDNYNQVKISPSATHEASALDAIPKIPDTHESVAEHAGTLPPQEPAVPPSQKSTKRKRVKAQKAPKPQDPNLAHRHSLWVVYANEFERKYGFMPTRSAIENTKIKEISEALNEEAEAIIIQYLKSNDEFYVKEKHPLRFVMMNCNKLRSELRRKAVQSKPKITNADDL